MRLIKVTPIVDGEIFKPLNFELREDNKICFHFGNGYTEMSAPGLRMERLQIKESLSEIIAMMEIEKEIYENT